ncbi:MAG: 1,2-phenylacetyl-CoA epoxidase subunit PaaD [Anaerolineae bacterium]
MMDTAVIWQALQDVKDPEIPVVSLVEMGIVREVALAENSVVVTITPTFSGCPALHAMKQDIIARLTGMGYAHVTVETSLSPPWTSDWITDEAREKLRRFGLAPPPYHTRLIPLTDVAVSHCPRCGSANTTLKNSFGPTLCRAIWYCHDCQDAFEQFKPL